MAMAVANPWVMTRWEEKMDYPYGADITLVRPVFYYNLIYTFGGRYFSNRVSGMIAAFSPSNNEWYKKGVLRTARYSPGVIAAASFEGFYIVGGRNDQNQQMMSEVCKFSLERLVCTSEGPPINECKDHCLFV